MLSTLFTYFLWFAATLGIDLVECPPPPPGGDVAQECSAPSDQGTPLALPSEHIYNGF